MDSNPYKIIYKKVENKFYDVKTGVKIKKKGSLQFRL